MPPIAVFDTNVLVSAIGWDGMPRRCLELARDGKCQAVTCEALMEKLASILQRRLRFSQQQVFETYQWLTAFLQFVPITGNLTGLCSDPKDDKVLECAIVAKATHVVSGDRKHLLPLGHYQETAIVSPAEFVKLLMPTEP